MKTGFTNFLECLNLYLDLQSGIASVNESVVHKKGWLPNLLMDGLYLASNLCKYRNQKYNTKKRSDRPKNHLAVY